MVVDSTEKLMSLLAGALHHWLSYLTVTSNSNVLAESSVRYPLVEFLERRLGCSISLEVEHSVFPSRHIDFMFNHQAQDYYIELKYASKHTRKKKRDSASIQ